MGHVMGGVTILVSGVPGHVAQDVPMIVIPCVSTPVLMFVQRPVLKYVMVAQVVRDVLLDVAHPAVGIVIMPVCRVAQHYALMDVRPLV